MNTKSQRNKPNTRIIHDYKNADEAGLIKFIKDYDFCNTVFNLPIENQPEAYTEILKVAFDKFVPRKTVLIRPTDQSWCNNFTRLLLRKKNRNYHFYKKCELDYQNILKHPNSAPELDTRLLNKRNKAHNKTKIFC